MYHSGIITPMKKSCQDLEKNLGKIFSRSCKNLARNQAIQDFCMDLEQESCKIRKILASSKSWHGFGTDFLPTCQILKRLGKILQDIFDRDITFLWVVILFPGIPLCNYDNSIMLYNIIHPLL